MGGYLTSVVFQPPEVTYTHAKRPLIWLRTKGGAQIPAFYINNQAKVTILFSHGNAEDLGMIYEWFAGFSRELRVNLLAYDYEGYGKTTGHPSERACYEDIDAAYSFLTEKEMVPPGHIVLYGRSLGSGSSLYLAERLSRAGVKLGGLILQSALLSVFRVAFPFRFTFPCDMFPNVDRVASVTCPIFVIHGTKDEVIPFSNGEDLFLAAPVHLRAKPFWIDGGGHNNLENFYGADAVFVEQFREFLTEWVPPYLSRDMSGSSSQPVKQQPAAPLSQSQPQQNPLPQAKKSVSGRA